MSSPVPVIGPYRLIRKLGEGGMGEVYEALHEKLERPVAMKLLRPEYARDGEATRRFFNEARATNRIKHPGLVQVSDFGQREDGTAYIVMELLHGENLGRRLKRLGHKLPLAQALHISWQIASALAAAHEKGIVHRDLKPDNIMLVPDEVTPTGERAKLLDFGLAKLANEAKGQVSVTRSHHIMGTPLYMSPEQCRGAGVVDEKSDVYALGIMLYQLIAGRTPFAAEGVGELISHHISDEPPPLAERAPQAPAELCALVHRLLKKDKNARPTMNEVVAELEKLEGRQGSAGARVAARSESADVAPNIGLSHGKLKSLLAGALEPETEDESFAQSDVSSLPPHLAFDRTMPSGDHTQNASGHKTLDVQTRFATKTRISAQTLLTGNVSTLAGELPPSLSPAGKRRSMVLAMLFGAAVALGAVWILRPAPAQKTDAGSSAPPVLHAPDTNSPAVAPAAPSPVEKTVDRVALPVSAAASDGDEAERASRLKKTARVRGVAAKSGAASSGLARPALPVESKPIDASRKQSFKIIE